MSDFTYWLLEEPCKSSLSNGSRAGENHEAQMLGKADDPIYINLQNIKYAFFPLYHFLFCSLKCSITLQGNSNVFNIAFSSLEG